MRAMGAALHALRTEWSFKLDDMYKRANKSLVMKCRYVEKVKLTDLWVTINVNSFNLVESLLLTYWSILTETQFRPSQFQWRKQQTSDYHTHTDPTRMVVMGAVLHALSTEWSAKLDDMYKREPTSPWS